MQIYNLSFDNGLGEITVNESAGIVAIMLSEKNPSYPGGGQFNVPLNPIIEALKAKQSNILAKWGLGLLEEVVDKS